MKIAVPSYQVRAGCESVWSGTSLCKSLDLPLQHKRWILNVIVQYTSMSKVAGSIITMKINVSLKLTVLLKSISVMNVL